MSETNYIMVGEDDHELRIDIEGTVITVWVYSGRTWRIMPRPSWVVAAVFDMADYQPKDDTGSDYGPVVPGSLQEAMMDAEAGDHIEWEGDTYIVVKDGEDTKSE